MPHVNVEATVSLRLSHDEFRLVGLGLAGKLNGNDVHEALRLNVHLMEQRAAQLKSAVEVAEGALAKAKEL